MNKSINQMKIIYILTYLITAINTYSVSHYRNNIKSNSILSSVSNKLTNLISFNEIPYEEDDSDLIGMEALQSHTISKKLTINELKTTWENEKKRRKRSTYHLRNSIHNYYTDKIPIELVRDNDSVDVSSDNEVYLTEPELRRLWQESSFKSFGKPITQFNLAESLLLLPDEDEEDVMGDDTMFDIASESSKPLKSLSLDDAVVITDPYEYVITSEVSLCALYCVLFICL